MSGVKSWSGKTRHGTPSGWSKHKNEGSDPCDACVAAKREYDKRWKSIPEVKARNRLSAKAQMAAYRALAHRYAAEYHALYESHADAFFAESGLSRTRRRKPLAGDPSP